MSLLKQIQTTTFLTDGGLETDMIFNKGIDLPHFASFLLIDNPVHLETLKNYYRDYLNIAKKNKTGFILDSPTWRANPDWGFKLGYSEEEISQINKRAIDILKELKSEYSNAISNIFISGQLGPRGDGYISGQHMSIEESQEYHNLQIAAFKSAGADLVTAQTTNCSNEATGITLAAKNNNLNAVISFTVETDGNLPSGETIEEVITKVDLLTDSYPLYYMINCAHPSHFYNRIENSTIWKSRIKGVRANASCKSHAELDESIELDKGNKKELAEWHKKLKDVLPHLKIYGGCCGTDASHVDTICEHILN